VFQNMTIGDQMVRPMTREAKHLSTLVAPADRSARTRSEPANSSAFSATHERPANSACDSHDRIQVQRLERQFNSRLI
jgi:hypothetical protein